MAVLVLVLLASLPSSQLEPRAVTKVLENTAESVGSIPSRVSPMLSAAFAGYGWSWGHGAVTIVRQGGWLIRRIYEYIASNLAC